MGVKVALLLFVFISAGRAMPENPNNGYQVKKTHTHTVEGERGHVRPLLHYRQMFKKIGEN